MGKRIKGTGRAAAAGAVIGAAAGHLMTPADTLVNKIVPNVYGEGMGTIVPTAIHHASQAPAGAVTGAAIAAGLVGGAHLLLSGRQGFKHK